MEEVKMDHSDDELSDLKKRFHRIRDDYDYPTEKPKGINTRNSENMTMNNFCRQHSRKENNDERVSFICTICETSFKRKNSLYRHIRNIHEEFFTVWNRGVKRGINREHFTQNKKQKIMDDDDDKLTGDYDLSQTSAARNHKNMINFVEEHSRKENKDERALFICTICNTTFKRLNTLTRHIRSIHGEFFSDWNRKNKQTKIEAEHSRKENKDGKVVFICTICNTTFKRLNTLTRHIRNIHEEFFSDWNRKNKRKFTQITGNRLTNKKLRKEFLCSFCGLYFKTAISLKRHEQNIHDFHTKNSSGLKRKEYGGMTEDKRYIKRHKSKKKTPITYQNYF